MYKKINKKILNCRMFTDLCINYELTIIEYNNTFMIKIPNQYYKIVPKKIALLNKFIKYFKKNIQGGLNV